MKQRKILLFIVLLLVVITSLVAIWQRYDQLQPVAINPPAKTPTITYRGDSVMTDEDRKKADAPGPKEPTIEIPRDTKLPEPVATPAINAPKQEEVRESVEKEYTYYPLLTANDPGYASNWAIQKVKAPAAWDISTGNGQTVVAVIDSGYALNHDDLKNNWFINVNESGTTSLGDQCWTGVAQDKTTNNCDDDGNGYIDDWRGWNFFLGDNSPMAGRTNPTGAGVAHGTETSGLVGSAGNNNVGIATINWNTKIMPLQALSDDGPGYTSDVVAAIYYAVDNGADVINMSLGGDTYDAAMKAATDYAYSNNVVVVAAAGNCGSSGTPGCENLPNGAMSYPALNDHVISVGATTINDVRASFSSYGPNLDVVAPGSGTIASPTWSSTNNTSLYSGALYGTSYAAPQVASLVSLIKSIRPASTSDDIAALLLATTTRPAAMNGALYTNELGHGIINAQAALTIGSALNNTTATPLLLQAGGVKSEHSYAASDTLGSGCATTASTYCTVWMRNASNGYERYLPYQLSSQAGSTGWSWSGSYLPSGDWNLRALQGDRRSTPYALINK